jgi:polysaccharide biosynthesis/export protein
MKRAVAGLALLIALAACTPADGPTLTGVVTSAARNDVPILPLSTEAVAALNQLGPTNPQGSIARLGGSDYVPGIIKPGDQISVTIFDTGEEGLFTAADSASLPLGDFQVSPSGTVTLPFVGTLNIAGRSTQAAQNLVTEKLRESAINPFATVNITRKDSDTFSVQGAVAAGGVYDLTARSERILDGIAAAGGTTSEPQDTLVTLVRGASTGQQTLAQLVSSAADNVPLQPGDVIIVGGGEATFIADGALTSTGEFPFVEGDFSLAQAVAATGGLLASRANPRAVFVFRSLGAAEVIQIRQPDDSVLPVGGDVILRINFSDPVERLRAGRFQMRDGDVVYVGDAPLATFAKFFQIFNTPPELPTVPEP